MDNALTYNAPVLENRGTYSHPHPAHHREAGVQGQQAILEAGNSRQFIATAGPTTASPIAGVSLGALQSRPGFAVLPTMGGGTMNADGSSGPESTAISDRLVQDGTRASIDWFNPRMSANGANTMSAMPPTVPAFTAISSVISEVENAPLGLFPEATVAKPEASVTSLTQPMNRPSLDRSTVFQIVQTSPQPGQPSVEITLNPEELGRVKMSLSSVDGVISVMLTAERLETMDLLRRYATELSQEYQSLGYQDVDLQFQQQGQKQADAGARDRPDLAHSQPASPDFPSQIHAVSLSQTGIDIRV